MQFYPWVSKFPGEEDDNPPPVFSPGEFHVQRSLVGYSLWGLKELDTTEHTHTSPHWKVNSQLLDCQGSPKSFLL